MAYCTAYIVNRYGLFLKKSCNTLLFCYKQSPFLLDTKRSHAVLLLHRRHPLHGNPYTNLRQQFTTHHLYGSDEIRQQPTFGHHYTVYCQYCLRHLQELFTHQHHVLNCFPRWKRLRARWKRCGAWWKWLSTWWKRFRICWKRLCAKWKRVSAWWKWFRI